MNKMKLQKTSNDQFIITLPKSLVLAKGWKKGEELSIRIDERGRLLIS